MSNKPLTVIERVKTQFGGAVGLSVKMNALHKSPDLHITSQAISQWKRVPMARVLDVERVTGISRHELRPDLANIFAGEAA